MQVLHYENILIYITTQPPILTCLNNSCNNLKTKFMSAGLRIMRPFTVIPHVTGSKHMRQEYSSLVNFFRYNLISTGKRRRQYRSRR
jgi:hypothetical protein